MTRPERERVVRAVEPVLREAFADTVPATDDLWRADAERIADAALDAAKPADMEIVMTPTPAQYEQLVHDLGVLREAGAESNTQAIVDAVRAAAAGGDPSGQCGSDW